VALLGSVFVLATSSAGARAEALVPVEGSWSGVTSVGLPVSFKVEGANVVDARYPATHASFLAVPGEISPPPRSSTTP
jgi:hypothetical protein